MSRNMAMNRMPQSTRSLAEVGIDRKGSSDSSDSDASEPRNKNNNNNNNRNNNNNNNNRNQQNQNNKNNNKNEKNNNNKRYESDDDADSDAGGYAEKASCCKKALLPIIGAVVGICALVAAGVSVGTMLTVMNSSKSSSTSASGSSGDTTTTMATTSTTAGNTTTTSAANLCGGVICVTNSQCISQSCVCNFGFYNSSGQCVPLGTYQKACANNNQCDNNQKLICATGASPCNCPQTSQANFCDCTTGFYWDYNTVSCQNLKKYGEVCTSGLHYQCVPNIGLSCNGTCSCGSTNYWTGTICASKMPLNSKCNATYQCQDYQNPPHYCISNNCSCPSGYYVSGSTCMPEKTYQASCSGLSGECSSSKGLYCPTVSNGCNCPSTSSAFKCDCPSNMYWSGTSCVSRKAYAVSCNSVNYECLSGFVCNGTYCSCPSTLYWNGTACVSKKTYLDPCASSNECNATRGLVCPTVHNTCNCPNATTAFKCDCQSANYWDSSLQSCVPRKSYGAACTNGLDYQCQSGSNMICSGAICTCVAATQYWNNSQCVGKKIYLEPCMTSVECNSTKGLICPVTNNTCSCPTSATAYKCDCQPSSFWDTPSQTCVPRKAYANSCAFGADYQCVLGANLVCTGNCSCASTHYWSGSQCLTKKTYTDSCTSSNECNNTKGLICPTTNGTCSCPIVATAFKCDCPPTFYWDSITQTCLTRKSYGNPCSNGLDYQCIAGFNLGCTGTCNCTGTDYWNGTLCVGRKTYLEICSLSSQCNQAKGLTCPIVHYSCNCPNTTTAYKCDCAPTSFWDAGVNACVMRSAYGQACTNGVHYQCTFGSNMICNGTCTCSGLNYWNNTQCVPLKTYQQTCAASKECNSTAGLTCPSVSSNCNCPTLSTALKCDCPITTYWDGNACVPRKAYSAACVTGLHYQCTYGLNLICNGTCKCNYTDYWTGSTCVAKKFNGSCASTTECKDYLTPAVTCISGQCSCPATHYPSNGACLLKKTYQVTCGSSIECNNTANLVCPSVSTGCNCPTASTSFKCDCNITHYWDGASCVLRKPYYTVCTIGQNHQCVANLGLFCNGTCRCNYTNYWNVTGSVCSLKKFNGSCVNTTECRDYLSPAVTCISGQCSCPATHFPSNGACLLKKTYQVVCAANVECNSTAGLVCPSVSSNCNCPTTSVALKCDCNSTSYYWDGTNCVVRKPYYTVCTTGLHYQCTYGKGLICNGTCKCNYTQYWNVSGSTCVTKKFNGTCVNTTECQDYLNPAVTCITGKCSCPATHYPSNGACLLKKTYQVACTAVQECNNTAGLTCPPAANGCNCPNTSVALRCDCNNTANYWDGTNCVARIAYNVACTPLNANYKCVTGKNLICNTTCSCPAATHFWNATTLTCDTKKTYMAACTAASVECNATAGLLCPATSTGCNCPTTSVAAKCDCPLWKYWDATTKMCLNRKTFGQACTAGQTYQCIANALLTCTGTCTCSYSSYYWNGATCASRIYLLFYATTTNYTTKTIATYGASPVSLNTVYDVRIQETPAYRIYIIDAVINQIAQYNQSRTFIKNVAVASTPARYGDAVPGGNFYVARYLSGSNVMMQYSSALALLSNAAVGSTTYIQLQTHLRYWAQTTRLYEVDATRRYINPFTTGLVLQTTELFICTFGGVAYTPAAIGFYRSAAGVNLLYVTLTNNRIALVNQATKAYITMTGIVCTAGYVYGITIDQISGYMIMSCTSDNALRLWSTDGSTHTNLGKLISIATPYGTAYDSWGRLAVAMGSNAAKVTIYNPTGYPFP